MKKLVKAFVLSASFCAWQPAQALTTNLLPVADAAMRDGSPDAPAFLKMIKSKWGSPR